MKRIKIDIDTLEPEIYLYGDIIKLTKHRFAWRFFKDYLKAELGMERIVIPINDIEPIALLSTITDTLHKYGFIHEQSNNSEQILMDFFEEEKNFTDFSKQALNIRNNNFNSNDLDEFTKIIGESMPARCLYPLQLLSAYHLAFAQNACNFSVPGSGKTSIVYGAYAYLKNLPENNSKKVNQLLIVGPLNSFGPWELEYFECFGVNPRVKRLVGNLTREEKCNYLYSEYTDELTLVSYQSLVSLKDSISFFLKYNRVMVVLDEAHKAKNTSGGHIAQSVLDISKYCKSRVVLTGTPAPNGYEDLYNMFKFIWPTKNTTGFEVNQLRNITKQALDNREDSRVDKLIENISPFFIRIKKSDLNIPPAIINPPIKVEMGLVQKKIYDFIENKYMKRLIVDDINSYSMSNLKKTLVQARMIRLMQAATNPAMLKKPLEEIIDNESGLFEDNRIIDDSDIFTEIMEYENKETPSKYIAVRKIIEKIISDGGKVIVWATFIHTILSLKNYLNKYGIKSQELYGAIPVEKDEDKEEESNEQILTRERIIKEFHSETCPYQVIIANPFAVGESISLHKACHNAIYVERSFNAAHFIQSKDRIHRVGLQPLDKINYYFILANNSIDETIDKRLLDKETRMNEIMESMPIPLFDSVNLEVGNEDIKELIKDYVRRTKKY